MALTGLRFCAVSDEETARARARVLTDLGLVNTLEDGASFPGAVFPTADRASWAEFWAEGAGMPAGVMLQLVVDDADAMAEKARDAGLEVMGPMDLHGERIYGAQLPGGLGLAFLSRT